MSFGMGGSSVSQKTSATSATTTPWSTIAGQLAPTLMQQLKGLAGGSSIAQGVSAIGDVFKRTTQQGIANIKEAFGKSGLRFSSDVAKSIGDFSTGQSVQEALQVQQFQQQAVQNQLSALAEIISLGQGTSTTQQTGSMTGGSFGWNFAAKLVGPQ